MKKGTLDLKQKKKKLNWSRIKKQVTPLFIASPYLTIFAIFFIIPFLYGILISFFDWNLFFPEQTTYVGFENYHKILFDVESIFHTYFWTGLKNTLLFVVVSVPFLIGIPLILAMLIDIKPFGYKFFRTILFMPTVLSISAVILIWKWQFYSNGGFINSILVKLGFEEIPFLLSQPWAWISIVLVTIWWTMGTNMVIFGAGLKNIDKSMYEAASIDGANYFQSMRYITIPSLAPQMFIVAITTMIASFNIYGQPDLLTQGGPNFSTTVLMMRIRGLAYGANSKPGIATSMAIMMGLIMIVLSLVQAKYLRKRGA
ncbi:carbohydrate ABC transporter permease [Candidatus Izemoplasma sp. B36]|uniref:carbohydrate ABC transporter permease n=1 Tax=Candidatus Izemoplasma sp. B36 TaxID=3242468 RepID=UPI003556C7CA